jgi:hypothetical protein
VVLDLGQAAQSLVVILGAGLGLLPGQAVRAQHPQIAAIDLQPLDVHLVVRPGRQVEVVAELKRLVLAVARAGLQLQTLDRGQLVVGHPKRAPCTTSADRSPLTGSSAWASSWAERNDSRI